MKSFSPDGSIKESHISPDDNNGENVPETSPMPNASPKIRVLLVDAVNESRQYLKQMLLEEECEVVTAINGIEGLICLKMGDFDTAFISIDNETIHGLICAEEYHKWLQSRMYIETVPPISTKSAVPPTPVLKDTLIVGVTEPTVCTADHAYDSMDVFITHPLNRSTINALLFPANDLLFSMKYKHDHVKTTPTDIVSTSSDDDSVSDFIPSNVSVIPSEKISFLSCFSVPSCHMSSIDLSR
eukprot:CAMPEP_0182428682 /NCGR_PEP_ID=MMETSP1167-20130531/23206_1 /TAXON_ID=2988 /ORGANISM="Mallomonas Sp, Strain CCMP3275" /LENGTH=241 /DNA_ID=CAMNT_0024611711 /DNA_START=278 /DNA_END=1003 /DNA_ORIENTATION=+